MIFRPELVDKIRVGEKTETRRLVKGNPQTAVCRYKVGSTYAVQPGRTQRGVARIRVTDVRLEVLGGIDHAGARREGFPSVEAFFDYWRSLHGEADPDLAVWVIRFELEER